MNNVAFCTFKLILPQENKLANKKQLGHGKDLVVSFFMLFVVTEKIVKNSCKWL